MTLRQRDIALVPVPFTDLSANKRRPVAVLSTTSHNRKSEEEVVAAVASNTAAPGRTVAISSSDRSEETNGKVLAKEVVSMFLVTLSISWQVGKVVLKPFSICKVACLGMISNAPKLDSSSLVA